MGLRRILLLSCAATGTFLGLTQAASAQDAGDRIGEVVVTAEKREQSIQDVPVAVSAYTAETREALSVISLEDYARAAPSVVYTNNDRLTIRGISRQTNAIGTDPAAASYSDGVFSNSMQLAGVTPLFVDRVEILRGPQGTLYGRNAIAGLLNVIFKRPSDEFEGQLNGRVGNFGTANIEGRVSIPIADWLRTSIGGYVQHRGEGYIENIGTGRDGGEGNRTYYDLTAEADLGSDVRANLHVFSLHWGDTYGVGNVLQNVISPYHTTQVIGTSGNGQNLYYNPQFTGNPNGLINGIASPGVSDVYKISANRDTTGWLHDHLAANFNLSWDLGGTTLKYAAGWQGYKYFTTGVDNTLTDLTGTRSVPTPFGLATGVSFDMSGFYDEAQEWFSNEINLISDNDGPFNWILGLYQYQQDYSQDIGLRVYGDPILTTPVGYTLPVAGSTEGTSPNPLANLSNSEGTLIVKSYAGFARGELEFAPHWTAILGLRYTSDKKEGSDYNRLVARNFTTAALGGNNTQISSDLTILALCAPATLAGCQALGMFEREGGGLQRNLEYESDAVTGDFNLQWEPTNDTNFYFRYARGYKSGGFFGISTLVQDIYADPEYVDSYELGAKMTFFDQFQANLATYFTDYRGMQVPLATFNGTVTQTALQNLDSEIKGFEWELAWYPTGNLILASSGAWTDSEITEGCCFTDVADPSALALGAKPSGPTAGFQDGQIRQPQTLVGNRNINTPEWRYNFSAIYQMETDLGDFTLSGIWSHTDKQQYRLFANPIYTSPGYETVNFRLAYDAPDGQFQVAAFVNNAFNEAGRLFTDVYSQPSRSATPGQSHEARQIIALSLPREFGVELQYKF
jgi:iron complex outermembrane receptor protein